MIWQNGVVYSETEAVVSIYDSAMMFGDTVFEMMRTYNRHTFMLEDHIKRLYRSANMLEIDMPIVQEGMIRAHEDLLGRHIDKYPNEQEWRTLINVSRGLLPIYAEMGELGTKITIACFPLRYVINPKLYNGVSAVVPSQRAIPQELLDPRIKSRSRQHLQVANLQAGRIDPDAWALMLDTNGFIAESTGANFFMVKDYCIVTPKGINCLRGISRDYVFNLANDNFFDINIIEDDITLYDAMNAKEAFFTCTPYGIVPCTKIEGRVIGAGGIGKITQDLIDLWAEEVECDFVNQWKAVA